MLAALTSNPLFITVASWALGWLGLKLHGVRASSRLGKATAAIGEAAAIMAQLALTAPTDMTAPRLITECKGVVAVALAKVGIYEADRAPFQPLIDRAIAEAVEQWIRLHPARQGLPIPARAAA